MPASIKDHTSTASCREYAHLVNYDAVALENFNERQHWGHCIGESSTASVSPGNPLPLCADGKWGASVLSAVTWCVLAVERSQSDCCIERGTHQSQNLQSSQPSRRLLPIRATSRRKGTTLQDSYTNTSQAVEQRRKSGYSTVSHKLPSPPQPQRLNVDVAAKADYQRCSSSH